MNYYKKATFKDMKTNSDLLVGLDKTPAHWVYDEEWDEEKPYIFVKDNEIEVSLLPHAKTLKELYDKNLIYKTTLNDLV